MEHASLFEKSFFVTKVRKRVCERDSDNEIDWRTTMQSLTNSKESGK